MSECSLSGKGRVALLASVAANIFLVAFVLGRVNMGGPGMLPPPPFGPQGAFQHPMGGMGFLPHRTFGPGDLFQPGEVKADETRMRENFEKMSGLRKDFATQLQNGAVTKDQVLKHFADIDQVMDSVRKEARDRMAEKLSSMSEADRKTFAEGLLKRREGPLGEPHADRPSSQDRPPEMPPASQDRPPMPDKPEAR